MNKDPSNEVIDMMINELNEYISHLGHYFRSHTNQERASIINRLDETDNGMLSFRMYDDYYLCNVESKKLSQKEQDQLKNIILRTTNPDVASAVLTRNMNSCFSFIEEEKDKLRLVAIKTTSPYWAFHLYVSESRFLDKNKEIRLALRSIILNTKDIDVIGGILINADHLLSREDNLSSLELTPYEIENLKRAILESGDLSLILNLLWKNEKKIDDSEYVALTSYERLMFKKKLIESRDSKYSYYTYIQVGDLTEGERMVLKGAILQTKDSELACIILCNTDFFPILNQEERSYIKGLAVETKDRHHAEQALIYIYDLTQEERIRLEKISKIKNND